MSDKNLAWLVAYTLPKTEKKVNEKLQHMGIKTVLPLVEKIQVWSDRKKKVMFPLFPNYIFLQTSLAQRFKPLQLRELVRYISIGGQVVQVREKEMEMIQKAAIGSSGDIEVLNEKFSQKGLPVKVVKGPLAGLRGVVEHSRGKQKLLININSLQQVISLEVSADMLAKDMLGEHIEDFYAIPGTNYQSNQPQRY